SGRGPSDTSNSWNSPGLISAPALAVQVIFEVTSVTGAPCTSMGVSRVVFSVTAVQPAVGLTETEAMGASGGRKTSSLTVDALARSFGTRKATLVKLPCSAVRGLTVT